VPSWARHAAPSSARIEPALSTGAHTHDGFFFRFQFGGSYILLSGPGFSYIDGPGLGLDVALGAALTRRLVLYGGLGGAFDPRDTRPKVAGFGAGLVYYFPSNVFIGGGLDLGRLGGRDVIIIQIFDQTSKTERHTNLGALFKLEAGAEWWESDNWALGYAVQLLAGFAKENETFKLLGLSWQGFWEGVALSVLFSATYN
jgi:hypothetical protein